MMMYLQTKIFCSHLKNNLLFASGVYHQVWLDIQSDSELTAVVRSRQLHVYRNGKKVLVLAGKSAPKLLREDKLSAKLQAMGITISAK